MGIPLSELAAFSAVGVAAAAAHWYLGRLGRRLPRRLARRDGMRGRSQAVAHQRWQRRVELALLLPKLLLWAGVAWLLFARLPGVGMSRDAAFALVRGSVTAPLFTLGERSYSALNLVTLPALLATLWLVVSAVVALAKRQLARLSGGERGVHESLAILAKIVLSFLGAIVILEAWGLDVSSLAFLASVLGVGIGFGLQNIANNFVSGILIGLERPVQPGDFVNVGEFSGIVKKIGARSTQIETVDRVSILVPNSRFLEVEVINWSYGSPLCRIHVPIGVAYGSDPAMVRTALLEAAGAHPQVLPDPRPQARFVRFGESSLDFEILVYTAEPRGQFRLKSDLNYLVAASLARHGISVPFPQRDLHLRSPELLEAVRAWTQRTFSAEEIARARQPVRTPAAIAPEGPQETLPGAVWTGAELDALAERMRGVGGVAVADRRHLLRLHRACFVGSEAVDWLMKEGDRTREEGVAVGRLLAERGLLHHVLDEHGFRDGHFFFRFRADEAPGAAREGAEPVAARPSSAA